MSAQSAPPAATVTACLLIIGNEVLSGRTQDLNIKFIATRLGEIGIPPWDVLGGRAGFEQRFYEFGGDRALA